MTWDLNSRTFLAKAPCASLTNIMTGDRHKILKIFPFRSLWHCLAKRVEFAEKQKVLILFLFFLCLKGPCAGIPSLLGAWTCTWTWTVPSTPLLHLPSHFPNCIQSLPPSQLFWCRNLRIFRHLRKFSHFPSEPELLHDDVPDEAKELYLEAKPHPKAVTVTSAILTLLRH